MLGPQWYTWFSINDKVISRGGIPSPIGPFGHPGAFGQAMALTASAAIAYHLAVRRTPLTYVIVGLASLLALASLRRKAIMGVVVACGVVLLRVRRTRGAAMTVLAVVIPVLVLASGDLFLTIWSDVYDEYISGASTAARSLLYSTSFDIGLVNFPFGAGFGRFGTATAFDYYSPIYYEYGLNRNYGLAPVTGRFGTDTFWPAILGETGWIGVLGFAAGLFGIGRASSRLVGLAPSPHLRFLGLIGLAWSADAVLESSASAVYTSTPHYLLLFVIFGMVASALRHSLSGDAAASDDSIERATDPEREHVPGPVGVR
ncbi:MAG: O-antigen ligase family protein [Solirubrobacteraceae bacterium]|nr:O-antigen ligase family protein [Solirubrobacteraceae bacterium]